MDIGVFNTTRAYYGDGFVSTGLLVDMKKDVRTGGMLYMLRDDTMKQLVVARKRQDGLFDAVNAIKVPAMRAVFINEAKNTLGWN